MKYCKLCNGEMPSPQASEAAGTSVLCASCTSRLSGTTSDRALLESLNVPVLLMQGNPRQVVTANTQALQLFAKEVVEVEGHRGGEVFNCVHSFTEAGCGKDVNCENCIIKNAIVDTFVTATAHNVSTTLQIKRADGLTPHLLQVSTEKVGEYALVTIEKFADN